MTTDGTVIETEGLSRSFGPVRALDGFDVRIPVGKIVALVGPNGAGKTTLLLILAGLLAADGGRASVDDMDPIDDPFGVHAAVGWMPDFFGVYDGLTSAEYLELFGRAYRMTGAEASVRARDLLSIVKLEEFENEPVHILSRGQKQRLGFARAIVHAPRVLLLDEPASGLDPRARIELRDLLLGQKNDGASVIVSSHILSELEEMADVVVFVDAGRCKGVFPIGDLPRSRTARVWRLRALDGDALSASLMNMRIPFEQVPDGVDVEVADDSAAAALLKQLVEDGVPLSEATQLSRGLEGAFLEMENRV